MNENTNNTDDSTPAVSLDDFTSIMQHVVTTVDEDGLISLSLPEKISEQLNAQLEEQQESDGD